MKKIYETPQVTVTAFASENVMANTVQISNLTKASKTSTNTVTWGNQLP